MLLNDEQAKELAKYCFDLSKGIVLGVLGSFFVFSEQVRFSVFSIGLILGLFLVNYGLKLLRRF